MLGCLFDLFGGWIINVIWFVLSSIWELTRNFWRTQRARKAVRGFDAALREQQKREQELQRRASPFAQPAPEKTPPQLPPSQSPFAGAETLTED